MSLIRLLQEASSLDIASLKKAMQKDKNASLLFKKDLKLDDIPDKDAFLATVKYYVLNNDNVRSFIALRHNIRDLDKETLAKYRALRGNELDENKLKWLREFITDIFKEHASVQRGTMSADLRKELIEWLNSNGRYFNLRPWAQRELMAIPSLRPEKRILLYRGLLFSEHDLEERKTYDGTLEKGNGLRFLESVRKGSRTVDLSWDRPSSWSKHKGVAERFAKYGPASSNFAATLQWLERSMKKQNIDGSLGFIISTFAKPEDILIDVGMFNASMMQHGDEGEVILKPGEYVCRIVKKYTVEGEVDLTNDDAVNMETGEVVASLEKVREFAEKFKVPEDLKQLLEKKHAWKMSMSSLDLIKEKTFKQLVLDSTTTETLHLYDRVLSFFKEHLKDLDDDKLRADKFTHDAGLRRDAQQLKKLVERFNHEHTHTAFKSDKNPNGKVKKHELTPEQYRATIKDYDLHDVEKELLTRGYLTDHSAGKNFERLAKAVGASIPTSATLSRFGAAKQEPVIQETIQKFFDKLGLDAGSDKSENIKRMLNLLRKAQRNYYMIQELKNLEELLGEINVKKDN